MNKEKLFGFVRHMLTALGGWAAGSGYVDEQTVVMMVGVVMSGLGFIWSWVAPEKTVITAN